MNSIPSACHAHWRYLYHAAILETDRSVLAQRVSEAEKAILERGRELFYSASTPEDSTPEERDALDDALYILRALRTARQQNEI
jgi:hypothetical protein